MKSAICISLILLSGWAQAATVEPKIISSKDDIGKLELGSSITEALANFDRDFKLLEPSQFIPSTKDIFAGSSSETPMAIVADFNGDAIKDVVVMGHSRKDLLVLAVISNKAGYQVKIVSRSAYTDPEKSFYPPMVQDDAVSDESEAEVLRQKGLFRYLVIVPPGDDLASGMLKQEVKSSVAAFSLETYFSSSNPVFFFKTPNNQLCEVIGTKIQNKKKVLKTKCQT